MTLARCKNHPPQNDRAKHPFTGFTLPLGYPETAALCGRNKCTEPAQLWLTEGEQVEHTNGTRVFDLGNKILKVRSSDYLRKAS
jgi:hypothetical protein